MKQFMEQLKELFSAYGMIALVLASLATGYVLVGWDLIPDSIPILGYIDDVLMVLVAWFLGGAVGRMLLGKRMKK